MTKTARLGVILACVMLMVLALWRYLPRTANQRPEAGDSKMTTEAVQAPSNSTRHITLPRERSELEHLAAELGVTTQQLHEIRERTENLKRDPEWDSKRLILFYGKVIDEYGLPVRDAQIRFGWTDAKGDGVSASVSSDSEGRFALGAKGKNLQVRVEKSGYYAVTRSNRISFEYADPGKSSYHRPQEKTPVIFYLRKRRMGADLITSEYGARSNLPINVPTNGEPISVDFLRRKTGASGQMQIQAWKEPKDPTTGRNNWRFRLVVPDGGFVEHDDEFPFKAPAAGYQTALEWEFSGQGTNWQAALAKSFYIRFGTPPMFGRISIHASAFGAATFVEYAVNPSGSRDLEKALKVLPNAATFIE